MGDKSDSALLDLLKHNHCSAWPGGLRQHVTQASPPKSRDATTQSSGNKSRCAKSDSASPALKKLKTAVEFASHVQLGGMSSSAARSTSDVYFEQLAELLRRSMHAGFLSLVALPGGKARKQQHILQARAVLRQGFSFKS